MNRNICIVVVLAVAASTAILGAEAQLQGDSRLNREYMDERVFAECLGEENLKALGDADIRYTLDARSGPYMDDIIQTTVKVCVPDPADSPAIKYWTAPFDLGTGAPNYGSIFDLFGYRPIKEGCFTAEMFLPRNITEPLPLIVNTPPMQSPYSFRTYREVNRKVASYGFMTIVSAEDNSRRGWMSEVKIGNRGIQLKQFIEAQNEKPDSLLYQKYSGRAGVWGMSMGGGAALYAAYNKEAGFEAVYALAPTYHASDEKKKEGGYGAWNTIDMKIPVFATGEQDQDLVDASIHEYFGEEKAPRISVIVRGASHFTLTNFFFSSLWMNVWFTLYLKDDARMIPAVWGPRGMAGTLTNDRSNISIQKRPQIAFAVSDEPAKSRKGPTSAPETESSEVMAKNSDDDDDEGVYLAAVKNLRDYTTASMCVVDINTGDIIEGIFLDREESKPFALPANVTEFAIVDLTDFTTIYGIKGVNY